jgi:hypothetical protein
MGKYTDAYNEFIAKYDLNLDIQAEYDGATLFKFVTLL